MWPDAFCVRKTKPFYSSVSENQKITGFFSLSCSLTQVKIKRYIQPHRFREYKLKTYIRFSYHIQFANLLSLTRKRAL